MSLFIKEVLPRLILSFDKKLDELVIKAILKLPKTKHTQNNIWRKTDENN